MRQFRYLLKQNVNNVWRCLETFDHDTFRQLIVKHNDLI